MSYVFLVAAIAFEVCGTLLLPTTEEFTQPLPTAGMLVCYVVAFYGLSIAVKTIPLAITYAIWSALGTALVALFGAVVYKQGLDVRTICGLVLITAGVALVSGHGGLDHST